MRIFILIVIVSLQSLAFAKGDCQDHFYARQAPAPSADRILCKRGFVIGYDVKLKAPVWSAERLSTDRIVRAARLERKDYFHTEELLPSSDRRDLRDFAGDGMDRGHLAPSSDMPDYESQYDSFSLANMVPQDPEHNRGIWRGVEDTVRDQVFEFGEAYVVTGAVYPSGRSLEVPVPLVLYKAVYFPKVGVSGVYASANEPAAVVSIHSLNEFEHRYGFRVFPAVQATGELHAAILAKPYEIDGSPSTFEDTDHAPMWSFDVHRLIDFVRQCFLWIAKWLL